MALSDLNVAIPRASIARLFKSIYPQRAWMLIYLASRPRSHQASCMTFSCPKEKALLRSLLAHQYNIPIDIIWPLPHITPGKPCCFSNISCLPPLLP